MAKLAPYNNLPPRPEYINKIIGMLSRNPESRIIDIVNKTKLTRTQVLCSLDMLLKNGKVEGTGQPRLYSLSP